MNNRRPRRTKSAASSAWFDGLTLIGVIGVAIAALVLWPDHLVADLAVPAAIAIAVGFRRR